MEFHIGMNDTFGENGKNEMQITGNIGTAWYHTARPAWWKKKLSNGRYLTLVMERREDRKKEHFDTRFSKAAIPHLASKTLLKACSMHACTLMEQVW